MKILRFLSFFLFSFLIVSSFSQETKWHEVDKIAVLEVSSSINPATFNFLNDGFTKAAKKKANLIVISLNTPGGLVTTTKKILTLFGESTIPIVVWVKPEGASATSAGAIIASGAHLLYMSEGTNIGAATPVTMGKDIDKNSDMRKKAVNDLVALVKGLSEARGRNPVPFQKMIEEAKSFSSKDALKEKLINGIVNTRGELIKTLDKATYHLQGQDYSLKLNSPEFVTIEMDPGQKLLNTFANPSLAYILFLIGAALIYLELQAPGGFIAGGIGAVCLVMAGIGFQVLPLNMGALGLIVLSFILFIMEAYITSYGILTLGGLASMIAGSLFLFRTEDAYLTFSTSLIFGAVSAIGVFLALIVYMISRDHKNIGKENFNSMQGLKAQIISLTPSDNDGHFLYQVKVGGEIWKAESSNEYQVGDYTEVIDQVENSISLKI